MNNHDEFYKYWFKGLNYFIETGNNVCVNELLNICSQHCSESFSKEIYQKNVKINDSIMNNLSRLHNAFLDFNYEIFKDKIHIIYSKCGCDLVKDKIIKSCKLCTCSEKSLLYNWESVYGAGNVKVKLLKSILHNDSACIFEVKIKQCGHQK